MPAHPRREYETDAFREAWWSKEPIHAIAERLGVSAPAIVRAAKRRGWPGRYEIQSQENQ